MVTQPHPLHPIPESACDSPCPWSAFSPPWLWRNFCHLDRGLNNATSYSTNPLPSTFSLIVRSPWPASTCMQWTSLLLVNICTVESHESRNGASAGFLEPAQSPFSICLNYGDLAFLVPSGWFGCLSFTLVRFSAIPTFMRFYGTSIGVMTITHWVLLYSAAYTLQTQVLLLASSPC